MPLIPFVFNLSIINLLFLVSEHARPNIHKNTDGTDFLSWKAGKTPSINVNIAF